MDHRFNQRILTNSVRFRFLKENDLFFKYAVTFTPELPSPVRRLLVIQQFHEVLGKMYLFDDLRNVIYLPRSIETTTTALPADAEPSPSNRGSAQQVYRLGAKIPYHEERTVEVEFRRVDVSATSSSPHTHSFLTVLVRRGFVLLGVRRLGDGVYDTKIQLPELRIEIQCGIRLGTREIEQAPMLWMEPSFRVTRTQSLLDLLSSVNTEDEDVRRLTFEKLVFSKMIRTPTRTTAFYPVHKVRWDLNPLSTFLYSNENISFLDYYREQYGIQIVDLSQPILLTKCGRLPKRGANNLYQCRQPMIMDSEQYFVVHIPELCFTCDIRKESKSNPAMSNEIEKYVNPSPKKMVCILKSYMDQLQSSQTVQKLFNQWNIQLESSFVEVVGTVLPGPRIIMNKSLTLDFGDTLIRNNLEAQLNFRTSAGSTPFYACVPLLHWILISTIEDTPLAAKFAESFAAECSSSGLEYVGVKSICTKLFVDGSERESLAVKFVQALRQVEMSYQVVVFILPRSSPATLYQTVKRLCSVEFGVPSQAIRAKTLTTKVFTGVVKDITRQVCCKLGGAPWALDTRNEDMDEAIMTVGIDAYHSRTRQSSVYAIVFTLNPQCTKYYTRTLMQYPGLETGDTLGPIFFDAYVEFYKECGRWPSRVLVFRDGVSNMYLGLIKDHEIAQMKRSLELLTTPRPTLTVILVQKYTTDRLVLLHGEDFLNPIPGTVVDNTITRTDYQDFFLFSQMSRGNNVSVQPTRCVVLEDEVGDFEFIKRATYAASFTYFNWPGSIRIPAVCQYAHKAAGFVGHVLKEDPSERLQSTLFYL